MKREDFIQTSTVVRVKEKKLLNKQQLLNLSEAKSFEDAINILKDTPYGEEIEKLEKKEAYDTALDNHLQTVYRDIKEMNSGEEVVRYATVKYMAHNLKVLVKEYILKADFSSILSPLADTRVSKIRQILSQERYSEETPEEKAVSLARLDYEEYKDPQRIDILLDKYRLEESLRIAKDFKIKYFIDLSVGEIDISNVKTILRSKSQGKDLGFVRDALCEGGTIPIDSILQIYNESMDMILERLARTGFSSSLQNGIDEYKEKKTLQGLEKSLDDFRMEMIKRAKSITYGPEILYAYLLAKETEIKNIRIILVSKLNVIPIEEIQERLRENYG